MVSFASHPDPDEDMLCAPAHSIAAEQAVIGGLLHDNRAWDRIYDLITEHDFYRADHRELYRHIGALIEANKPADPVTLQQRIEAHLVPYMAEIYAGTPSAINIRSHAQIVRDSSILRQLVGAGTDIAEAALAQGANPQECAEQAEARVLAVLDRDAQDQAREPILLKQAVFAAVDYLDSERTAGISTGYTALDAMLPGGGLQAEQLIIVAGRPSMGKSALCYGIAERAALEGKTCMYFSLETSSRDVGVRALRWQQAQLGSRSEALRLLSEPPLIIDDSPAIGLGHMRVRLRRIRRQRGLSMVVVDYLQLMRQRAQNRLEEVSEISRGLKAIAKEFQVPVLVVSQLNRSVESRPDKRPQLSDLRESGQIEQDADVVLMCYRDEYYNADTHLKGFGEVFVRKNRDGPVGEALLRWNGPLTRWIDYTGDRPAPKADQGTVLAGSANVREFKPKGGDAA